MIDAAMKLLYIRDPKTGDFKPLVAIKGDKGDKGDSDGRNAWIRFSANADGSGFTSTWSPGQNYIGFASAITEPTDKSAYIWVDLAQIARSLTNELKTSLEAKLDTEKQARIDGQNTLSNRITDLEEDLGTETSDRVNEQNTLSNRITNLGKDLVAEVSARVNQQNTLADRITDLETEFNGDHSELIQLKSNFTLLAQRVTRLENG